MFDSPLHLALGFLTGFLFGFVLQKGRLTNYAVIVGQFLLRDFTVLKTMLTAIIVGGFGVYAMHELGWVSLHVKPAVVIAIAAGGLIFGAGMALLGYCPGTAVGAVGEGSRHALFGVLGMLVGAALYAELYAFIHPLVSSIDLGAVTFPQLTGTSPWLWLFGLAAFAVALFWAIESLERSAGAPTQFERVDVRPASEARDKEPAAVHTR